MNSGNRFGQLAFALSVTIAVGALANAVRIDDHQQPVGTWIGHYVIQGTGFRSAEEDASLSDALMRRHYREYVKLVLDKSGSFTWRLMNPDDTVANTQPGYTAGEGFKGTWQRHDSTVVFTTTHTLSNFSEDAHKLSAPAYIKVLSKDSWQASFDANSHLIRFLDSRRNAAIVFEKRQ